MDYATALGRIWAQVSGPGTGRQIENAALSKALSTYQFKFTKGEWANFRVHDDVQANDYVKVGEMFFQPVAPASFNDKQREFLDAQALKEDRFMWTLKRHALEQAIQVMSTGAQAAIHNTDQECRPEFKWQDFNRFFNGDCVSFGIRTAGDIDIALATLPTRPEGALLMHIGTKDPFFRPITQTSQPTTGEREDTK